jgi:hypothetical protein
MRQQVVASADRSTSPKASSGVAVHGTPVARGTRLVVTVGAIGGDKQERTRAVPSASHFKETRMSRILQLQRLPISQDHSMGFMHSGISVHCTNMHPSDQSDWCCNPDLET